MFIVFIAAAALAAAVAVCALVRQRRRLRAQLARERAAHRLTEGCLYRDMAAFRRRIEAVAAERAVVAEAGRVVDAALAYHAHHSPIDPTTEGGLA
ncbi:hypothetical protein OIA45_48950 (plasmid) [Streptomyces chartreusis]|uniref:hypothetical protein n=1 Tax=Streptomyces chartreusis TaxID=1969 RepID=UPI0037DDE336|nr:hypothetical protein OIA45_48950 [Streptomyces chartreusis]